MRLLKCVGSCSRLLPLLTAMMSASPSFGQATQRSLFVSNNGNLEGSATAFTINPDGTLTFVNRIITGMRPTTADPCAGCNAYEISITPNGQYLATSHPAGDLDGITIFSVAANSTIAQMFQMPLPIGQGAPLDLVWTDNTHLIVTRGETNPDQLVTYLWNPAGPSLTFVDARQVGTSTSYLAMHPTGQYLYASDSGTGHLVYAFSVAPNGVLTQIDAESVGTPFPLEIAVSPDGTRLYSAGGISAGGVAVAGLNIAPDGTLSPMLNSPYTSQGASPSNVFVSDSGQYVIVGHGTDATARTMSMNQATGELTATGVSFDVGLQGTLGDVRVVNGVVFVTDNSTAIDGLTGVYSFTLGAGGTLNQNGPIVLTQGIAPRSMAHWIPPMPKCPGDANGNHVVDIDDLVLVITNWNAAAGPGDVNDDSIVNIDDLVLVITHWGTCPS